MVKVNDLHLEIVREKCRSPQKSKRECYNAHAFIHMNVYVYEHSYKTNSPEQRLRVLLVVVGEMDDSIFVELSFFLYSTFEAHDVYSPHIFKFTYEYIDLHLYRRPRKLSLALLILRRQLAELPQNLFNYYLN